MIFATTFNGTDVALSITVVVLLACAGVLALAETGLNRTSRARARSLVEQHRHGGRALLRLVDEPERFLAPVLLLVLICQLVAATLVGVIAERLFGGLGVFLATVFEVVFIFVAAEAIPKNWAVRNGDRAALFSAPIIAAVIKFPPVRLLSRLLNGLAHLLTPGGAGADDDVTESELLALADEALEDETIEHEERALISSVIEFGDTIVREVMAPRPDIVAVEAETPASAVLETAMVSGLSRIPIYEKTLDDVVAIAYTRDLIRASQESDPHAPVRALGRPAHYVPETKRVAPLLREMQAQQYHLAIVVDEYGGTAGIVTLEDLIEELVGEISDEYDVDEPLIQPLAEGEYRVSGKMSIDEVNELLRADLPVGDWDTIGGLFLHLAGHVPVQGESARVDHKLLVAERVQARRISQVRIVMEEPNEHASASKS